MGDRRSGRKDQARKFPLTALSLNATWSTLPWAGWCAHTMKHHAETLFRCWEQHLSTAQCSGALLCYCEYLCKEWFPQGKGQPRLNALGNPILSTVRDLLTWPLSSSMQIIARKFLVLCVTIGWFFGAEILRFLIILPCWTFPSDPALTPPHTRIYKYPVWPWTPPFATCYCLFLVHSKYSAMPSYLLFLHY